MSDSRACKISWCLVLLGAARLAVGAEAVHLTDDALMATAEDGTVYRTGALAHELAPQRRDRYPGKVSPEVSQRAFSDDRVRVLVYLFDPDGRRARAAENVKAAYRARLDQLASDIRVIERKYRPAHSIPRHEETMAVREMFGDITAADQAQLLQLRQTLDDTLTEMRHVVGAVLASRQSEASPHVLRTITQRGGRVHTQLPLVNAVSATVDLALLNQLAKLDSVAAITLDRAQDLELATSMEAAGFPTWWNSPEQYDGGPFDAAVIDTGVQQDHPDLTPNSFFTNAASPTDANGHGTHVAGILASANAQHTGGAFGLDALIWAQSGNQSATMANMHWTVTGPVQTPEALNHSLGYGIADARDYSANDTFYDAFVSTFNVLVATSAGNEGWSDTSPRITHPATAYNVLAVANMDGRETVQRRDDVRADDSSVGPTLNGRRKPDITAPGTNILSTNNSWAGNPTSDPDPNCWNAGARRGHDVMRCSGTSMATPHVAAAGVLLNDAGVSDPKVQKAVLINAADAWTSNGTRSRDDDSEVAGTFWDKSYGWGYLDMDESYFNRTDYFVDSVVPRNDTALNDDYKLYRGTMFAGEKATLVWEKRAGTYVAGEPAVDTYALNDLNMRLYDGNTGQAVDDDLSGPDNVHQVAASSTIDAVVKVYAWSQSFAGTASESYALATEENFAAVEPPAFRHFHSSPAWVGPNQTFDVTVDIDNLGQVTAHSNVLTVQGISGADATDNPNIPVPPIAGGGRRSVNVSITTNGIGSGTRWLPLQFVSDSYAESFTYSRPQGVEIRVERNRPVGRCTQATTWVSDEAARIFWTASDEQTGVDLSYLYVRTPGSGVWTELPGPQPGLFGVFEYTPDGDDGDYDFAVRSVDRGGNWESLPSSAECSTRVDRVAPASTVSTPFLELDATVPMSYSATDSAPSSGLEDVEFWYRRDDQANWVSTGVVASASSGVAVFALPADAPDGVYYFFSRASDRAGNEESLFPAGSEGDSSTLLDRTAPLGGITINNGDATTISTLVDLLLPVSAVGIPVQDMRLSNDGTTYSAWEPYASTINAFSLLSLGGNADPGVKTVFVQYRDGVGRISRAFTDQIELIASVDSDGDGIGDADDNCTLIANADQRDTNGDGFGNVCDADLNNDGVINVVDLGILRSVFFTADADADLNGDGVVNVVDLGVMRAAFFGAPGPSGVAP